MTDKVIQSVELSHIDQVVHSDTVVTIPSDRDAAQEENPSADTGFLMPHRSLRLELPHEPVHRRLEPLIQVQVLQTAAGYSKILAPSSGLHYVKILGGTITLDAAGTLQFVQGAGAAGDPAMTGAMTVALNGGFVWPTVPTDRPYLFSSPGQVLGIFTGTGKANGWLMCCQSPHDQ